MENDDLLALLNSNEKPFKGDAEVSSDNKPKINYWEDNSIEPKKVNIEDVKTVKEFTFVMHSSDGSGLPDEVAEKVVELSKALFNKGYGFRYSGAGGDIYTKIIGVDYTKISSYLPYPKLNESAPNVITKYSSPCAYHHAAHYHKGFKKIANGARAFSARDINVILGKDCNRAIQFLLCYSPDGADTIKATKFEKTGFISFSISVCEQLSIPVFNLKNDDALSKFIEFLKTISN